MFAFGTVAMALASTVTLWGDFKAGMKADEVRSASKSDPIVLSPYCSASVRPTLVHGKLVAVELVAQSTQTSPEEKAQKMIIVPCETDFRRYLAGRFGKAVDTNFITPPDSMKMIARNRTYVRDCVVAHLHLSHLPSEPTTLRFSLAKDGEYQRKDAASGELAPLICSQST
jgi:hypothetical protein